MSDYIVILKDGTKLTIKATSVEYLKGDNHIRFYSDRRVIARFNLNNIAGWIETDKLRKE